MSTPPVPHWVRLQFEDRIRNTTTPIQDVNTVCGTARDVSRLYPWAREADTANALINAHGTGWGAIYCDWAHRHQGRRAA